MGLDPSSWQRRGAWATPATAVPVAPVYYWAGEGSAIVHRLKGFRFDVDEAAYAAAYAPERLRWLHDTAGADFLFLSYNWGLPPELESADWAGFATATNEAHRLGLGVAAYVQPSNAVAVGSYAARDWYATTPKGKRIPYYAGRFFTCLHHPGWRQTVHERVAGAIEAGADAVFLDNCAFGGMPIPLSRDYTAFAGCYCPRCQRSFRDWQAARGEPPTGIPRLFRPGRDPVAREYAHWRAWTLTDFLREIRDAMRRRDPRVLLLTNTFGAVNVNTYNLFGVDLPEVAQVVDWLFVENLQSPRAGEGVLVQNAGTFKLLQSLRPGAPTLSISYEKGIGVDAVPPPRVFRRTLAEAYAAGGVPVIRVGEYIEHDAWTLLQPGRHEAQVAAAREIAEFVRAHPGVFEGRRSAAAVAVYVPPGLGWRGDVFPREGSDFLGVLQALVGAAIPFRVVGGFADLDGIRALLLPAGTRAPSGFRGLVLRYDELGIERRPRTMFDYFGRPLEPVVRRVGPWIVDGYFSRVHVRRLVDRLDLIFRFVFAGGARLHALAPAVANRLRALHPVSVFAAGPVYADLWRTATGLQLHLVNYGDAPVRVDLVSALGAPSRLLTPAGAAEPRGGRLELDTYAVLEWHGGAEAV
jgi:hypothetical protein